MDSPLVIEQSSSKIAYFPIDLSIVKTIVPLAIH